MPYALFLSILFWPLIAEARHWKAPSPHEIERARLYIATVNRLDIQDVTLEVSAPSEQTCYWKLQFKITGASNGDITIYLSPNRRFLFSDFHDVNVDPLEDVRRHNESVTRALTSGDPPSRGSLTGKVTIVEFADCECPSYARLSVVMEEQVKGDSSARLVFRNVPLEKHPWARIAAEMGQ